MHSPCQGAEIRDGLDLPLFESWLRAAGQAPPACWWPGFFPRLWPNFSGCSGNSWKFGAQRDWSEPGKILLPRDRAVFAANRGVPQAMPRFRALARSCWLFVEQQLRSRCLILSKTRLAVRQPNSPEFRAPGPAEFSRSPLRHRILAALRAFLCRWTSVPAGAASVRARAPRRRRGWCFLNTMQRRRPGMSGLAT